MTSGLGVVIPAYQPDPDRLAIYIDTLESTLEPARIHVELDAPAPAVTDRLAATCATIATVESRRGKGKAITAGFERLETPILGFVDADGSTQAAEFDQIVSHVRNGNADLAVGSRRHPQAHVSVHQSRFRRRFGDLFAHIAGIVLPLSLYDYQCGAKVMTRETWDGIRDGLVTPGFAWDIDLLSTAHRRGYRINEVPITWEDREGSTVDTVSTGIDFALALLRAHHLHRVERGRPIHSGLSRFISQPTPLIEQPLVDE